MSEFRPDFKAAGIAMSNIVIMATTMVKLANAEKLGNGLSLTHEEVKAVLFTLRTLKDGYKESRERASTKTGRLRTG